MARRTNPAVPINENGWQAILLQHTSVRWRNSAAAVGMDAEIGLPRKRVTQCYSRAEVREFLGGIRRPGLRWNIVVEFKGGGWPQLFLDDPAAFDLDALEASPKLSVIIFGYAAEKAETYLRLFRRGRKSIDFSARGCPDQPLSDYTLKASAAIKRAIRNQKTNADALKALLTQVNAQWPPLRVQFDGELIRLTQSDGKAVKASEIAAVEYGRCVPMTAKQYLVADQLATAIVKGDPGAVRKALQASPPLDVLSDGTDSVLGCAIRRQETERWVECAKELLEAGAPIDNYPEQESLVVSATRFTKSETAVIDRLSFLLAHGADVNARGRHELRGQTVAHQAVQAMQLGVLKYLVHRGANVKARDHEGRTPRKLAEQLAHEQPNLQAQWQAIIKFLRDAEHGVARTDDYQAFADAAEQERQAARMRKLQPNADLGIAATLLGEDEGPGAALAEAKAMAMMMPDTVKVMPLTKVRWRASRQVAALEQSLVDLGFISLGPMQLEGIKPLRLIGLHHGSLPLYAIVAEFENRRHIEIARFARDGSSITATTSPVQGMDDYFPPNHIKLRLSEATAAQLMSVVLEHPSAASDAARSTANQFAPLLEKAYAEETAYRKARIRAEVQGEDPQTLAAMGMMVMMGARRSGAR